MMEYGWKVPLAVLAVAGLTAVMAIVLIHMPPAVAQDTCTGIQVKPGDELTPPDDLDAVVNSDPRDRATTFCLNAYSDGTTATYEVSETLRLKDGDELVGERGEIVTLDETAKYGVPKVEIRPTDPDSLTSIVAAVGKDVQIEWVDIAGGFGKTINGKPQTGTGAGITAGAADSGFLLKFSPQVLSRARQRHRGHPQRQGARPKQRVLRQHPES